MYISKKRKRSKKIKKSICFVLCALAIIFICVNFLGEKAKVQFIGLMPFLSDNKKTIMQPDEMLQLYISYVNEHKYEEMYALLSENIKTSISKEDFISKNKNIYEGIEASNLTINITETSDMDEALITVSFDAHMHTLAGEVSFPNQALFTKNEEKEYRLLWYSQLIFPELSPNDKIRVNTLKAERGNIYDRNGETLAGKGIASSVGFVPGKMSEEKETDIARVSELLDMPIETINKKLNASYVKDNTFVPLRMIPKSQLELESALLEVKGIKITDSPVRFYPFGEKTSHLTGYIQNVTAEDLERLKGQDYNANSVIGKSGVEKIYEDHLRGIDGYEIIIVDSEGNKKQTLAAKYQRDGENIHLTIDAEIQGMLYNQFCEDKSCSVAINPKTGEVLALVSTPTFDANDFVLGLSTNKWNALNEDVNKPLYNRFKAALCPGSGFKSVIAAIGLTTGIIRPEDNYGPSGRSWQKDGSWGGYKVTTLKEYGGPANLRNALIYSDNIYFAKAALNIGGDVLSEQLINIGFDEKIPFEYPLYSSIFSNTSSFDSEIQIADSGYGQAQILVNPIHMASIYSAFLNGGSMIKPYLIYKGNPSPQYWKEQAFTKEAADIVREDLIQVVEQGAGGLAKIESVLLAGKTGTAEIKQTKDDKEGTELGWFNVFTADMNAEKPLLVIAMVEDVKNRGGSGYVIPKIKAVFKSS